MSSDKQYKLKITETTLRHIIRVEYPTHHIHAVNNCRFVFRLKLSIIDNLLIFLSEQQQC